VIVCEELGIPYEHVVVDLRKGEQKSPDYVKLQPFGQVPLIDVSLLSDHYPHYCSKVV
jgi:glutathione S-transferase